MRNYLLLFFLLVLLFSCKNGDATDHTLDNRKIEGSNSSVSSTQGISSSEKSQPQNKEDFVDQRMARFAQEEVGDTIIVDRTYSNTGFDATIYYDLLIETHLCDPNYSDTSKNEGHPCSARFFIFYPYNHHRRIEDGFCLQVRAGVDGYPYQRLLIFVREKGQLVLMNGFVGYLVKRIPQKSGLDNLIVAIYDDLGNGKFDRYDILVSYKDGKYRFVRAVGDTYGKFKKEDLIKRASKAIHQRIKKKNLIF